MSDSKPSLAHHARAAALGLVGTAMLVLGTPGLSSMSGEDRVTRGDVWETHALYGPTGVAAMEVAHNVNEAWRVPLLPFFRPLTIPFCVGQTWSMFSEGRKRQHWFEVWVDDRRVYRSQRDKYEWRRPLFENRHVRPTVDSFASAKDTPLTEGFVRWVLRLARADFPQAQEVILKAKSSDFPKGHSRGERAFGAAAPEWNIRRL